MSELADASGESGPDPPTRRCHVLPHPINARAMQSDIESFRLLCNTHAVETVFTVHQSRLDGAFAHFATGRGGAEVEMDLEQWLRFMEAARLCDEGLSVEVSTLLYSMIQTDENPRLSYAEFQQALVTVTCFKFPAPWLTLSYRVNKLLTDTIFPNLKEVLGFANNAMPTPTPHVGGDLSPQDITKISKHWLTVSRSVSTILNPVHRIHSSSFSEASPDVSSLPPELDGALAADASSDSDALRQSSSVVLAQGDVVPPGFLRSPTSGQRIRRRSRAVRDGTAAAQKMADLHNSLNAPDQGIG